jgi:hypothetical protein
MVGSCEHRSEHSEFREMLENSLAAMKLSDAKKARSAEIVTSYVTLKQSLNRPGHALRVQSGHEGGGLSDLRTGRLYPPASIPSTHF